MIVPTNGRVVLYTPGEFEPSIARYDAKQALTAHVVHVWGDRMVNLVVFDSDGVAHQRSSVRLLQDSDTRLSHEASCEWMSYQKGQAAKTEALEAKVVADAAL